MYYLLQKHRINRAHMGFLCYIIIMNFAHTTNINIRIRAIMCLLKTLRQRKQISKFLIPNFLPLSFDMLSTMLLCYHFFAQKGKWHNYPTVTPLITKPMLLDYRAFQLNRSYVKIT